MEMPDLNTILAGVFMVLGAVSLVRGHQHYAHAAAMFSLATFNIVAKIALTVVP